MGYYEILLKPKGKYDFTLNTNKIFVKLHIFWHFGNIQAKGKLYRSPLSSVTINMVTNSFTL